MHQYAREESKEPQETKTCFPNVKIVGYEAVIKRFILYFGSRLLKEEVRSLDT